MAKKERAAEEAAAPSGRPAFADHYPRDPRLDQLVEAFVAGNFAHVRGHAPALAAEAEDEDIKLAAQDLRRRIEPPGTAKFLWGLAMALLALLFTHYIQGAAPH